MVTKQVEAVRNKWAACVIIDDMLSYLRFLNVICDFVKISKTCVVVVVISGFNLGT